MTLTAKQPLPSTDDAEIEALIEKKKAEQKQRDWIAALREELTRCEMSIARAKFDGAEPYWRGTGPYADPPIGVPPWQFKPPTGDDLLPSFMNQRENILRQLEAAGEVVE